MRKIYKVTFLLCLLFLSSFLRAQQKDLWSSIDEAKIVISKLQRKIHPKKYKTFELDLQRLKNDLNFGISYKSRAKGSSMLISFPDENGEFVEFEITEASVMHPELAEKYPNNRSFKGFSVTHPSKKIRFSLNEVGLSAIIMGSESGYTLIEPLGTDIKYYKVFSQSALQGSKDLQCLTESAPLEKNLFKNAGNQVDQGHLKIYRLALAANGEYSQFHLKDQNVTGGSEYDKKSVVMGTLTAAVTRINAVLERDLAISMQLVAKNDALIFLDPTQDPYDDNFQTTDDGILNQNQATVDKIITPRNYDIGHVLTTTPGVARLRSVCVDGIKAQGVSGSFEPVGNNFYFDVICHEIGHQLGANHTFNGSEASCGNKEQRVDATAVEPGSGSSIMSYGGYCGTQNIQSHSDLYFHGLSLIEINAFIREGETANCADQELFVINKNLPKVYAGEDLIIPVGTPFKLTGEGSDADGDLITYNWEQIDAGVTVVPPSENARSGALFRSRNPSLEPVRYFPNLKSLRNGNISNKWEVISEVARELNFLLTVRDNNEEGGQVVSDDVKLTITDQAGPFLIVSQNSDDETWVSGTQEMIKWDVAGTNSNGVNVSQVNILLSTDGGFSYPTLLASNVSNNGLYNITVPDVQAPHCYIMVEAVDNAFFAINSNPFSIGSFESVCATYESKDIPKEVIFGSSNNAISLSEIDEDYEIENITVSVKIKHPFIKDLALSLESPSGTVIELLKNPCDFNDQDIDAIFSDDGEQIFCASLSPTISGNNLALSEFSELNGESAKGIWKLKVADEAPGDDGVLEAWSMTICTAKSVLAVTENSLGNFQIYPNPSEGQFRVVFSTEAVGEVAISIYDLLGRKLLENIYKEASVNFDEVFNAEELISGIYILKVNRGQKVSFRKIKIK